MGRIVQIEMGLRRELRERDDGRRLKKKSSGARAMQCVQERECVCIPWIDAASN